MTLQGFVKNLSAETAGASGQAPTRFSIAHGATSRPQHGNCLIIGMLGDNMSAIHGKPAPCGAPAMKKKKGACGAPIFIDGKTPICRDTLS